MVCAGRPDKREFTGIVERHREKMHHAKKRVILCGLGAVGRAFSRLVWNRCEQISKRYGLDIEITAAVDVGGAAVSDHGALPLEGLLKHLEQGDAIEKFSPFGRPGVTGVETISNNPAEVLVEATPTNLVDGEPAKSHIFAALNNGLDVVSANKGPLVLFHHEVLKLAEEKGRKLYMSAATAAALPTLDVGRICLAGTNVLAVEGILNGTTNYILTRMHEDKCSFETALKKAQEMGIAETDPSLDVDGLDTRNKLVIIANQVFDTRLRMKDVPVEGIRHITLQEINKAVEAGKVIKLVAAAERCEDGLKISVEPKTLDREHPLSSVDYAEKGIRYQTDTMGSVTVTGGKSSPQGAAAALLKDLIHTVMICE